METKSAAYLKIYTKLREQIINGSYKNGDKLPSKRTMADETGTSVITIEHAYGLLQDEGYIEARERSGYFVCYSDEDLFPISDYVMPDFSLMPLSPEKKIKKHGEDAKKKAEKDATGQSEGFRAELGKQELYMTHGVIYEKLFTDDAHQDKDFTDKAKQDNTSSDQYEENKYTFPFPSFARTIRRVLSEYGEKLLEKSPNEGSQFLRESIARYLQRSRDISVQSDQIIVGAGSEYLYSLIVQMLGRDKLYALEDPSYEKIRKVYEANGARCEFLKLGARGIHSSELRKSEAKVLHVTPFDSFPSGVTATAGKRREYISWAENHSAMIIEDDYASEFSPSTKSEDTLFSLESDHTVLYLNTFTKTISPAIRVGYMVLPKSLTETLKQKIDFYSCTVPMFDQYVLAEFLNSGDFERHVNRIRRRRRQESK